MALADLDGDGKVDVVESQGQVEGHEDERVYFGTDVLAQGTASPVIRAAIARRMVVARIQDNRTPYLAADLGVTTVK